MSTHMGGTVKWFDHMKNGGEIVADDGSSVIVPSKNFLGGEHDQLKGCDRVEFDMEREGDHLVAYNVLKV